MRKKCIEWRARRAEDVLLSEWDKRIKQTADRSTSRARCSKDLSEDAQQEYRLAIVKAARRDLRAEPQIQRVITNAAKRHHRDQTRGLRSRARRTESLEAMIEINKHPEDEFVFVDPEHEQILARVRDVITSLPPDLRAVYEAIYVQELSTREAAPALGISRTTLSRRCERLKTIVGRRVHDLRAAA